MNRWSMKDLESLDDVTFAMSILNERTKDLNPEAPLTKKIRSAVNTLDDIRDHKPIDPPGYEHWGSMRERIFREKERGYFLNDLQYQLENEHPMLNTEKVLADEDIVDEIFRIYGKIESDHWENLRYAIEKGISSVFERRNCKDERDTQDAHRVG